MAAASKSDTITDLYPLNMRVRTLTHILKLVTPHITKSPTPAQPKASPTLRLLDCLSLLLVGDREITATLPIRSNAQDATRIVAICGGIEASGTPKGLVNYEHEGKKKTLRSCSSEIGAASLGRKLVRAGYIEFQKKKKIYVAAEVGVPQGGIISPLLSN